MSSEIIPQNVNVDSIEQFRKTMAAVESQNSKPNFTPAIIRLHGTNGQWMERKYNEATKKSEEIPFQDNADGIFLATPLIAMYFCRWKYDEQNTKMLIRTREFQRFDSEPIELLKIVYGDDKTTTDVIGRFNSYQEFKAKYSKTDEITGKVTSPYDFTVALYAYHWESKRIIKINMKGSSRSAWFDFPNATKEEFGVETITDLMVRFGKRQDSMKDGKTFYGADLKVERVNTIPEMNIIMAATLELDRWMKSFQQDGKTPEVHEIAADVSVVHATGEQEIRVEDIPF